MKVTQADLLDALRGVLARPATGDGLTGPEVARTLGCTDQRARNVLRVWMAEGKLEVVTLNRTALDGRTMTLRGYRMKGKRK